MDERVDTNGEEKRRRILDAAFAVCQERGVHAARMEEVAARAQVSKGTLYRFFESKEDLFLATIMDSYASVLRMSMSGPPPSRTGEAVDPAVLLRSRLEGLAKALGALTPRVRVHYQAWGVVADSPASSKRLDDFLSSFHRERMQEYEGWIREGQLRGVFRSEVSASTVAHCIGALISGFIYRSAFDPASATPDALQACFDTLIHNVLGYSEDARSTEVDPSG